jgi:hypothetical protein
MVQMLDSAGLVICQDESDYDFWIESVVVITPNGGESYVGGSQQTIKWRRLTYFNFACYRILLSRSAGSLYLDTVVQNVAPTESTFIWSVPAFNITTCRIKLEILDNSSNVMLADESDDNFTITTTVTVVTPNGIEVWQGGTMQTIKWRTLGTGFVRYRILFSQNSGSNYPDIIANNVPANESVYIWTTPPINLTTCRVKVQILDNFYNVISEDVSNGDFSIRTLATVISPNGGETWLGGTNQLIKWRTTGASFARYRVLFSQNGGSSYLDTIVHNIPPTESTYLWLTPLINNATCRVKVQILDALGNLVSEDASNGNFSIQTVIVVSPNGGEVWPGGSNQTIKWRTSNNLNLSHYRLLLSRGNFIDSDTIAHNVSFSESTYLWFIPAINVSTCRLKVQVLDSLNNIICQEASDGYFTIRTLPTVIFPNGGETWLGGTDLMVKWRTAGIGFARFRILFSQNSGLSYLDTISHNIPPTESTYLWLTPLINITTGRVKVQILDTLGNIVSEDASNENFTIQTIIVISPTGGEVWSGGSNQTVKWRSSSLFTASARFQLLLSRNGGATYTDTISHDVALTESTYLWLTPIINVTTGRIKVQVLDTSANVLCEDASNGDFTIHTITLISPNGGEYIQGGSTRTIRWRITMGGGFARFRILFSNNAGSSYSDTITDNVATTETLYNWTVPTLNCNTCRVMVQILDGVDNVMCEDASNSNFTIDSDSPSPFSLILPLNNAWTNASPRFVWHRATDNFAMSYYQLSIAIPAETLRINTSDSANPIPPTGSTWRQAAASAGWSSRYYHTSVVFDNKMWVIGGYDGSYRNDVWYSTNGINWICATNSAQWSPRCGHTSVVFDNKMWVIGGYDDNNRNDVWYSTDGVTWTCATQSAGWPSRDNHTSLAFDNKIWVMGGSNRDDVWYSSDGLNWTCATTFAWYYGGRYGHTSVVFDNKMWVIGGGYPGSDVWYSSNGVDWTEATSYAEWTARLNHTSVIFKGMMWVLGGFDRDYNTRRNDVWYSVSPPCLPEGIQTWWVTAFDRAGNSRHSNETFSVRVDTTPPSIPILIAPANGIILTNSSVTFIWHSSSDILSGFHYYRFQVANNINFINPTMTSVIDTFITTTLSDTTYFWRVKAIDSVENESEWSTVGYFRVRTTGIEEKQQQIFDITRLTVKVYPNPAKSFAEIHYTVPVKK